MRTVLILWVGLLVATSAAAGGRLDCPLCLHDIAFAPVPAAPWIPQTVYGAREAAKYGGRTDTREELCTKYHECDSRIQGVVYDRGDTHIDVSIGTLNRASLIAELAPDEQKRAFASQLAISIEVHLKAKDATFNPAGLRLICLPERFHCDPETLAYRRWVECQGPCFSQGPLEFPSGFSAYVIILNNLDPAVTGLRLSISNAIKKQPRRLPALVFRRLPYEHEDIRI